MASDPAIAVTPVVYADSAGVRLVAVPGDPARKDRWESWKVDAAGGVHGPNLLGNWLRFSPSDYAEAAGPHPPEVLALIARLSRA